MVKKNIDEIVVNSLKMHGVAAVNKANSGHPGVILSAAKMVYALYRDHMNFDVSDPN